ncbi:probable cytochrome P450 9f2 [Anopheles bellator]|uniref:probable cytochrome P450 9f2 n=1 Tax=Anopheles bellator TaxID=139047 RepID=UPI0026491263|nr:probable cytochrome P450 9f2 [Anopheles bellator]
MALVTVARSLLAGLVSFEGLLLLGSLALLYYYYVVRALRYFAERGVAHVRPTSVLGNGADFVLRRRHVSEVLSEMYQRFRRHRFFGYYDFLSPIYVIRDLELVKQICIKDFDHFLNHRMELDENHDPLFGRALFAMRDTRWKNMRAVLSPAFTGSKMRQMFGLVTAYCEAAVQTIRSETTSGDDGGAGRADLEMKELFRRFGNDILATCAFGIEINSFRDRTNAFYTLGKELTNLEGWQGIKFLAFSSFPRLMRLLRLRLFSARMTSFFRHVVRDTIAQREQQRIVRPDMINLLMAARKQELKFDENENVVPQGSADDEGGQLPAKRTMDWTDDDIVAQCTVFFFGGYDTVSTLSAFMAHELAVNPDVQRKLRDEIDEVRSSLGGRPLTYETMQSMAYLDMVAMETLRKWTPAPFLDRLCTKPYVLRDHDGHTVQLRKGDGVWIPAGAIMRDPDLFPEPDRFDPERFAGGPVDSTTMLAFGLGPRNCIGSRFALMETKAVFYYLLSTFHLEMGPQTQHPLRMKVSSLGPSAEKGFWIRFRVRSTQQEPTVN